jgi:hypothetical protein
VAPVTDKLYAVKGFMLCCFDLVFEEPFQQGNKIYMRCGTRTFEKDARFTRPITGPPAPTVVNEMEAMQAMQAAYPAPAPYPAGPVGFAPSPPTMHPQVLMQYPQSGAGVQPVTYTVNPVNSSAYL